MSDDEEIDFGVMTVDKWWGEKIEPKKVTVKKRDRYE